MRQLSLGGKVIQDNSDCYTIAEIGHNHQGKLKQPRKCFGWQKSVAPMQ